MEHGNGNHPARSTQPYSTPEADLVVFAGDQGRGRYAAPLNTLTDGTPVIAAGAVENVRMYGTADEPRAVFTLIAGDGGATYAAVGTATYDEIFGYLVEGDEVSLHGTAICAFPEDPKTIYIRVTRVEPLI